jgi:[acyl-carrier-protein] S-malonyltransferase
LQDHHLAFVFPAFTNDYADHPGQTMPGFDQYFSELLFKAASHTDQELAQFTFENRAFHDDELRTQYITYIYSCAASSLLRNNGLSPGFTAGYSMGIYAALFDGGAVSFETGLTLIRLAHGSLLKSLPGAEYTMGTLIGLDRKDIETLIDKSAFSIEITNQNASHSFVISGRRAEVHQLLKLAKEEGALNTRDLSVSIPYHSSELKAGAMDFADNLGKLDIGSPQTPVISLVDQALLTNPRMVAAELVRNLYYPLNWFNTMQALLGHGVSHFIECGPSKGLAKNARFIEGARNFYTLNAIPPASSD